MSWMPFLLCYISIWDISTLRCYLGESIRLRYRSKSRISLYQPENYSISEIVCASFLILCSWGEITSLGYNQARVTFFCSSCRGSDELPTEYRQSIQLLLPLFTCYDSYCRLRSMDFQLHSRKYVLRQFLLASSFFLQSINLKYTSIRSLTPQCEPWNPEVDDKSERTWSKRIGDRISSSQYIL